MCFGLDGVFGCLWCGCGFSFEVWSVFLMGRGGMFGGKVVFVL